MKTTKTQISVGNINIDKNIPNDETKNFVPQSEPFVENAKLLETIAFGITENLPVLMIGETGTGKTSAIRHLASVTQNAFRRLNLNGQTTVDEFVGKNLINEKGTYWTDGILTDAMRKGHWILLDEINSALPEVLFVLQSLLDDDKYIVLSDKEGNEIVRPHANFRLFASMNPSDNYVGTKELNKALMSRFPIVLEVKYPNEERELDIIRVRFPALAKGADFESEMLPIIQFGNELRNSYFDGHLDFVFSTRELINWVKLNEYLKNWKESASLSFLGKCNKEDRQAIEGILKIHFKDGKSVARGTTTIEDLKAQDTIVFIDDVPVGNTNYFISKGTVCLINMVYTNKPVGMGGAVSVTVNKYKAPKNSSKQYLYDGEAKSVFGRDIEGKFRLITK